MSNSTRPRRAAQTPHCVLLVITHVPPSIDDEPVSFRTEFGNGRARWRTPSIPPELGRSHAVEIDIDDIVEPGINTEKIAPASPSLAIDGDCLIFRGLLEHMDDDRVAFLRMADNCLIMIETAGDLSAGDTVRIKVPINSVSVTPIGC